jgi:dynein light chain Tctex-type 1
MIESLVAATSGEEATPYKFAVKSTIIENSAGGGGGGGASKRGMNSAVGAYWNSTKDGMWTYKYDTGDKMGFEVVITVIWIALDVVQT